MLELNLPRARGFEAENSGLVYELESRDPLYRDFAIFWEAPGKAPKKLCNITVYYDASAPAVIWDSHNSPTKQQLRNLLLWVGELLASENFPSGIKWL